jgi:hypothetical protein
MTTAAGRLLFVVRSPRDLPCRIAANVQMVAVQPGRHSATVDAELDLL